MRRPFVQQVQGATDMTVAQAREPTLALFRKRLDIVAHQLDEHEFAELGQYAVAAGALLFAFHDREPRELIDPAAMRGRGTADVQDTGQGLQQRVEVT